MRWTFHGAALRTQSDMMRISPLLVLCLSLVLPPPAHASWSDADAGVPFGKMSEKDWERFLVLAHSRGVDVNVELEKAYKGDGGALAKVFMTSFSTDV